MLPPLNNLRPSVELSVRPAVLVLHAVVPVRHLARPAWAEVVPEAVLPVRVRTVRLATKPVADSRVSQTLALAAPALVPVPHKPEQPTMVIRLDSSVPAVLTGVRTFIDSSPIVVILVSL